MTGGNTHHYTIEEMSIDKYLMRKIFLSMRQVPIMMYLSDDEIEASTPNFKNRGDIENEFEREDFYEISNSKFLSSV